MAIHGENVIQTVVGPKQVDECMRTYLTIQGDFVCVTIRNNAYRELCCGWAQNQALSLEVLMILLNLYPEAVRYF